MNDKLFSNPYFLYWDCEEFKVSKNPDFTGSFVECLVEAYGVNDFWIKNEHGFRLSSPSWQSKKKDYDVWFFKMVSQLCTSDELDEFKLLLRNR